MYALSQKYPRPALSSSKELHKPFKDVAIPAVASAVRRPCEKDRDVINDQKNQIVPACLRKEAMIG